MKKKIRYSEFPALQPPASVAPQTPAPPAAAAPAPAVPAAVRRPTPVIPMTRLTPAMPMPAQAGTPLGLARRVRATPAMSMAVVQAAAPAVPSISSEPLVRVRLSGPVRIADAGGRGSLREQARGRDGSCELLMFRVGRERFGVELAAVEEAIDLGVVHHVPEMPPAMLGVITVRGTHTPVYTPAEALGLSLESRASALIFKRGRARIALAIDDVDDVVTLDLSTLRDAPGHEADDYLVIGVVRRDDALFAIVDADALIAACQAVPTLETA
jgi:chemotaxis signal transduction protein